MGKPQFRLWKYLAYFDPHRGSLDGILSEVLYALYKYNLFSKEMTFRSLGG